MQIYAQALAFQVSKGESKTIAARAAANLAVLKDLAAHNIFS